MAPIQFLLNDRPESTTEPAGLLVQGDRSGDPTLVDFAAEYLRVKYAKPGNVYVGLVHRLDREAQVPLVSLHQFRHTCASDLLEGGVSLPEVQRMLGHASVQTPCRYLQVADPERAKAMQRHPINDLLRQPQPSGRAA